MASDTKFDQHLEEGLLPVAANEKGISTTTPRPSRTTNKMTAARRVLLTVLVCGLLTLSLASAIGHRAKPCSRHQEQVLVAEGEVQDPAKVDLVHRLLHAYFPERYQDGVYSSDKEAIAAFEADDAELASALGQLAKRQDNGTTTAPSATPTPSATDAPPSSASSAPPASDTPIPTPTPTPTPTPSPSPSPSTPATSSASVPSDTQQQQTTAQSSQPAPTTPTTPATSAAAPPTSANTRQTPTTTRASPQTTSFSEVRSTFTSTASNGEVVLVTATSFVAVDPEPAPTDSPESGGSGSGGGGLQNAASPIGGVSSLALPLSFAAFVAGAMLLL